MSRRPGLVSGHGLIVTWTHRGTPVCRSFKWQTGESRIMIIFGAIALDHTLDGHGLSCRVRPCAQASPRLAACQHGIFH